MRFLVFTLFPGMFGGPLGDGIIGRAVRNGLIEVGLYDIRDFAHDRHSSVDDYPYSGGPGMVMKPEPVFEAVETARERENVGEDAPVILLTPQGRPFTQRVVEELAGYNELSLVCGRYEGFDERIRQRLATDEISVGDYVLAGGELAAMVVIEAVSRLVPGVVGSPESPANDSFSTGLLQHPLYTRPARFRDMEVPPILLSGNHGEVARWQRRESLRRTLERRPDLLEGAELSDEDWGVLEELGGFDAEMRRGL